MHFGIDYGSKLAGTTVVTFNQNGNLRQRSFEKGKDADVLILETIKELVPSVIFIDAPLSLPLAYSNKGNDFFYREADRVLKAMSPMFLGGLTARAMKLKTQIEAEFGIAVHETYPAALIQAFSELSELYNKKDVKSIPPFMEAFHQKIPDFSIEERPKSYHSVDSLLAWYSGYRYLEGKASSVGNKKEGTIIF